MFDVIDICDLADMGRGSFKMMEMHRHAVDKINHGLPVHSHGYVWNDSVLLLSYVTKPASNRFKLLAELSEFKDFLEAQCYIKMYAISVMGQAFPQNNLAPAVFIGQITDQQRAVTLKTSSWAMANCFEIEKELGRYRADWYIDSRITADLKLVMPFVSKQVELLPKKKPRTIHMFRGKLLAAG